MHAALRAPLATLASLTLVSADAAPLARGATVVHGRPDVLSALIVVDAQNCCVEGGTLPVRDGLAVVLVINRLAPAFDNIVVTQDWHPQGNASFASSHASGEPFDTFAMTYGTQVLWPDHCVQGSDDAALVKGLALPTAQLLVRKGFHKDVDSYSAFEEADHRTSTGLAANLKARGIATVYVVGLATNFCVARTALDVRKAGFRTFVIEDSTRAIDLNGSLTASMTASMTAMKKAGVPVIRSSAITGS